MKSTQFNLIAVTLFILAQTNGAFAQTEQAPADTAGAPTTSRVVHTEDSESTETHTTGATAPDTQAPINNPNAQSAAAPAAAMTTTTTSQATDPNAGRAVEHNTGMTIALILFAILVAGGVTYALTNNRRRDGDTAPSSRA